MNHSLKRLVHGTIATVTALGVSTMGLAANAFASQLKNVVVTPTSTTEGTAGATFNITLTAPSAASYKSWSFIFATSPSDSGGSNVITTGALKPANFAISGTPTATVTSAGSADANFSVASTVTSGNILTLTATSAEVIAGANTAWTFSIPGITIPHVGDCSGNSGVNTDTCYVRILSTTTGATDGTGIIDQAVGSFSFTKTINLSATVDPYMTFSVSGITSNFSNYDSNIDTTAHPALGTPITTTTGTNIPFGNITVGTDKFAMQQLDVRTNASTGYKVYQKMTTDNNQVLKGTFTTGGVTNHIDPFAGGSSWDVSGAPTAAAWAEPTGLPNVLSGWMALQTAGPTGNATIGANWIGPVVNNSGTGGIVKSKTGPDNGVTGYSGDYTTNPAAGTSAYVTYRISVDAYQPADSYTGTMEYNVVANY